MKVRTPSQERSKETRSKIIEAATKLFAEKGYYNTNSKEIAREAGIAIGSFYAYFKDKKALFIEVIKKYLEVTDAGILEINGNLNIRDKTVFLAEILRGLFKSHEYYPEIYREVIIMSYADPDIQATYEEYCKDVLGNILSMFKVFHGQIRVKDEKTAGIIILSTLEGIVHRNRGLFSGIEDEQYIKELSDLIYRYLFDGE